MSCIVEVPEHSLQKCEGCIGLFRSQAQQDFDRSVTNVRVLCSASFTLETIFHSTMSFVRANIVNQSQHPEMTERPFHDALQLGCGCDADSGIPHATRESPVGIDGSLSELELARMFSAHLLQDQTAEP
jgi:hypothetical protein